MGLAANRLPFGHKDATLSQAAFTTVWQSGLKWASGNF
eukprot:CAMPEP_0204606748 /NCGR_PEP_ID=MMETSP0661-20131031/59279_1 /ASSEMBLY_ACC=CAM_ASM_000606 /TAXON_ID=109239 /ORGANISM="Alexandrium margalefi, Strain AMGDE01CS-322" /LENGTH=37 /DNA_ID= /DNA_START= /DNA_END= /DNA_ORIENTATION=